MKLEKNKKAFLLLSTYLIILFSPKTNASNSSDIIYNTEYVVNSLEPYATYSNGNIYISNKHVISQIVKDDSTDIYIIDDRLSKNPDISIVNSYKITSDKDKNEILEVIMDYEKNYPTEWNRTFTAMKNEWDVHNICYFFGIDRESTHEVNLDNNDERKYQSKILTMFLGN